MSGVEPLDRLDLDEQTSGDDKVDPEGRFNKGKLLRGEALPLDGVPVTVKENVATEGVPMPLGTGARHDAAPSPIDAPPAARLREGPAERRELAVQRDDGDWCAECGQCESHRNCGKCAARWHGVHVARRLAKAQALFA